MNERIKKLAEQAEDWADKQNFYESDYRDYFNEKFAELIVRACSEIAAQQGRVGWNEDRKTQARVDSELIKNHFGITG